VPVAWSDEFVKKLAELEITNNYFRHPGADHNMVGAWNQVVEQDLEFFAKELAI